jgi:orotate phosphoribosyltransferase
MARDMNPGESVVIVQDVIHHLGVHDQGHCALDEGLDVVKVAVFVDYTNSLQFGC